MKKMLLIVLSFTLIASNIFAKQSVNGRDQKVSNNKKEMLIKGEKIKKLTTNMNQVLTNGGKIIPQNIYKSMRLKTIDRPLRNLDEESDLIPLNRVPIPNNSNVSRDCSGGDCWDVSHVSEGDSYYYLGSGAANDTFAVVLTPAAPCVVQEVYQQWFDGGNVIAFGAEYGAASALSPNGDCYDIERGSTNLSPIGNLMTNYTPNTIEDYIADWSDAAQMDIGGTFQVGDETDLTSVSPFVIAFVKGGEAPHPLSNNNEVSGRTENYTWLGGPWNTDAGDSTWGRYHQVTELMTLVKVTYPWGAPIAASVSQLPNSYATSSTEVVYVSLFDDVDDTGVAIGGDDVVNFMYDVDGTITTLTLDDAVAEDVDASGNGIYSFSIDYSGFAGSVVSYWLEMIDNDNLVSETAAVSFLITAPINPDADLLIINDNGGAYNLGLYEQVAYNNGLVIETWNVNDNLGIHESVINYGWSNIIVYGWGTSTVPAVSGENDPGYGDFLDNGGNLLLVDQDWFYGHGLDPAPVFTEGDFAYDRFGLAGGMNDPMDETETFSAGDTLIYGLDDDGPFVDEPLYLNHNVYGTSNWSDFLTEGDGAGVYYGDSGEITGIQNGNAVYFAFMADAGIDTTESGDVDYSDFDTLLSYWLGSFNVTSPPIISNIDGPVGYLFTDEAQDVTATISDVDGDAITADLYYMASGNDALVASGAAGTYDLEIESGNYNFNGYDSYGDGWNGASAVLTDSDGNEIFNFTIDSGSSGAVSFSITDGTGGQTLIVGGGSWDSEISWDIEPSGDAVMVVMVDNGDGTFSGSLPGQSGGVTVSYWVSATDGNGTTTSEVWTYATYAPSNDVLFVLNNEMDPAGYPGAYYLSNAYDGYSLFTEPDVWSGGVVAELLAFYDTVIEITSTNTYDSFTNHYDAIHSWLQEGNKNYVLAGDETFYLLGYPAIEDGSFFSDMGISASLGDLSYYYSEYEGGSPLTAVNGNIISNGMYAGVMALGDTSSLMYDPVYEISFDYNWIDGATPTDDATATLYHTASGEAVGINKEWDNGNKTLWLGLDPISLNSSPTYVWWGASEDGTLAQALDWFGDVDLAIEETPVLPIEFALYPNYPNPFNPVTNIKFDVAIPGIINLKIYNILGEEIITLHNEYTLPGKYNVTWDGHNSLGMLAPSGVYFYKLTSNTYINSGKMILMK